MNNKKYVKLVKSVLTESDEIINELKINPTSSIRKKFLKLVKQKFIENGNNLIVHEVEETNEEEPITADDIKLFLAYKLLKKVGNVIKVTLKGIASALGMEVDSQEDDSNYGKDVIKNFALQKYGSNTEKVFKKLVIVTSRGMQVSDVL